MRNWKLTLAAAILVAPLGSLNAVMPAADAALAAPQTAAVAETEGQSWGCCWVLWQGRWMCLPC